MKHLVFNFVMNALAVSLLNLGAIFFLLRRHLQAKNEQKRRVHYCALYQMPVQRIMERVAAGESPAFHSYHVAHRPYIYQLMLNFAASYAGDFHSAFDYLGFTDDLLSGEISRSQEELLEDLAVIRSPMSKDYLYMLLLEEKERWVYQCAYALTRIEMEPGEKEIILPTLLNLPLPREQILEMMLQLRPPRDLCLQLLAEQHSEQSTAVLSFYLSSKYAQSGNRPGGQALTLLKPAAAAKRLESLPSSPVNNVLYPNQAAG